MGTRDQRVDAYIASRADFARPILEHLREVVHAGCPQVAETIKWGMPAFEYKGLLGGMAAFKQHAVFSFWKHELVFEDGAYASGAMGSFGRLTSLKDLPPKKTLLACVKKAAKLNDAGVKAPRTKSRPSKAVAMHPELKAALAKNKRATATFAAFPPSCKAEYLEWVAQAKRDETRARRIQQAVEWMAQGKRRNWKYQDC